METRANYVLLGAVTVAGFALAMLFALWLARATFDREFAVYDVVFDGPARGIGAGTEVRFNGIRVGEVSDLFMDPGQETNVVARIRIGATWPVRTDSDVRLEPLGLTGLNLIQISSGEATGALMRHRMGDPPPRIQARGAALDQILESSETIAQNATEALAGARDVLNQENAARLSRILKNLEDVSTTLAAEQGAIKNTARAAEELRVASRQFTATAREFELLARDGRQSLVALSANANTTLTNIGTAAESLGSASTFASTGALPELSAAARDMRRLAVTMERVATNIERSSTLASVGEQKPVVRVDP
ncbi:MAG: MlaD family protein [Hyphomonadaceae bacterium]|nr:MlaD family protein [Hyphomonadaceae bacterium]